MGPYGIYKGFSCIYHTTILDVYTYIVVWYGMLLYRAAVGDDFFYYYLKGLAYFKKSVYLYSYTDPFVKPWVAVRLERP